MQRPMRLLVLLSVTSSVSAWSFTWTNAEGKSYVEHDNDPVNCQTIDHAEGETFRWVPGDDGLSLWLYESDDCSGYRAGYSPPLAWTKDSSRDLRSFRVANEDAEDEPESTTTTTTTTTTTSKTTTSTTRPSTTTTARPPEPTESAEEEEEEESTHSGEETEPTQSTESTESTEPTESATSDEADESTPSSTTATQTLTSTEPTHTLSSPASETPTSDPPESNSSSTPVAAIAGGTIGGIAAIAAIGALFFFLGRRQRSPRDDPQPPGYGANDRPPTAATAPLAPLSVQPTPMYGAAAYDSAACEAKSELDSAPLYQVTDSQLPYTPVKQVYSPLDSPLTEPHYPPARMVAELPGDVVTVELSESHRLNELDGTGKTMTR
ncbi:hypothetical protein BJX63DRAFT_433012 [Aspergillus granulosus]|uniref:Uncharacterized protein n=1 Tax=Aspergillus granulosus TaxID=176169 RepID=A0ABR4H9L3_9EURO